MPAGYALTHDGARLRDPRNTSFVGLVYPESVWPGPTLPEGFEPGPAAMVFVECYADADVAEAIYEAGAGARREGERAGCDRYGVLPSGSPQRQGSPVFRIGRLIGQVTCLEGDELVEALTERVIAVLRQP